MQSVARWHSQLYNLPAQATTARLPLLEVFKIPFEACSVEFSIGAKKRKNSKNSQNSENKINRVHHIRDENPLIRSLNPLIRNLNLLLTNLFYFHFWIFEVLGPKKPLSVT